MDDTLPTVRKFKEMLKITNASNEVSLAQLQLNLLGSILSSALGVDWDALGLELLPKEDVTRYYEAAVQILSEAVLMYFILFSMLTTLGIKKMLRLTELKS